MSNDHRPNPIASFKPFFIKYLWQPLKVILCTIQLEVLQSLAFSGINATVEYWHPLYVAILALNALACAMLLYSFYDEIDDWAFYALRDEKLGFKASAKQRSLDPDLADLEALYGDSIPHTSDEDLPEPTHLMKKPGWIIAYILGIVSFAFLTGQYIAPLLSMTGMPPALFTILGYALGGLVFALIRLWRVCVLNNTWRIQIELVKPTEKRISIIKRILQGVAMYAALAFICYYIGGLYGIFTFLVMVFGIVTSFATEFPGATVLIVVVLGGLLLASKFVILNRWRKFFKRLKIAKKRGEIDYQIEGHPYLAAIFPKLYAGIVLTDLQRYKGKPVTYLVGICNVTARREAVILCDEYRAQIRHQINLRMGGRTLAIAASAQNADVKTGHSLAQWYTTVGIEFPNGEGEKVLLVDPAPTGLYLRDGQTERLQTLDNGSKVFDYTVWTKNAFFNMIDRM